MGRNWAREKNAYFAEQRKLNEASKAQRKDALPATKLCHQAKELQQGLNVSALTFKEQVELKAKLGATKERLRPLLQSPALEGQKRRLAANGKRGHKEKVRAGVRLPNPQTKTITTNPKAGWYLIYREMIDSGSGPPPTEPEGSWCVSSRYKYNSYKTAAAVQFYLYKKTGEWVNITRRIGD